MLPTTGQAARHACIALDAIIVTQGKMPWLSAYATDDGNLFGLVAVENEQVIEDYVRNAGDPVQGEGRWRGSA